jgi:predicted nucleic acid-binding protein
LAIAGQNATEFWSVCTRPASARGGWGLDIAEADRRLKAVEAAFPLLPELPTAYGIWRGLIVACAVQGKQVHDARLAALMMAHGITHVLTLNAGDFARFPGIVEPVPGSLAAPPTQQTPPPAP